MRRSIARGRLFPQGYSTDRRYGRLSLKAIGLFPLMWVNADDQGRLCGDPEEIKYTCCPNIDPLTKADIPYLLSELQENALIRVYNTSRSPAVQILDWWDTKLGQKLQWAWPSEYPPPDGWQDHLRYKKTAKEVVTLNWPVSGEDSGESQNNSQVSNETTPPESTLNSQVSANSSSAEAIELPPSLPQTPSYPPEEEHERGRGRGKRNSPEDSPERSGEKTTPTAVDLALLEKFPLAFGREPDSRELAYLRDIGFDISAAGATPQQIGDAYREAALCNKLNLSYVRAILFDWLGLERAPP